MKKAFRLARSRDFKRAKESGKSIYHPLVILVYTRSDQAQSRFAVVASKIIGNAVTRNLIKRRIKSCLIKFSKEVDQYWDLIFYSRKPILNASFEEICEAIEHLLNQAGVLGDKK